MNRYIVGDLVQWVDDFLLIKMYAGVGKNSEQEIRLNLRTMIIQDKDWGGNAESLHLHILFYHANKHRWFLELKNLQEWKPLRMSIWWNEIYIVELGNCIRYFEDIELLQLYTRDIEIHQLGIFFFSVIDYANRCDRIEIILAFNGLKYMAFQQSMIHFLHPDRISGEWGRFSNLVKKNDMFMRTFGCPEKAKCPSVSMCSKLMRDHGRFR